MRYNKDTKYHNPKKIIKILDCACSNKACEMKRKNCDIGPLNFFYYSHFPINLTYFYNYPC